MNTQIEQIQDMLKAWYPVLYFTTFEYEKTKQELRGIAKVMERNYQFYEWNCVDGLYKRDFSDDKKTTQIPDQEEPEELLKYIFEQFESSNNNAEIYVLEDFHDFIGERNIKIRLRQLAEKLKFYKRHIIIVSSVLTLPIELEKYVTVIELALPDREDLKKVLSKVAEDAEVKIDDNMQKKLIDAALGMTVMEADLAFCLAAVKNKFDINSPKIVASEKEQIIKKSGLLDYFQANEELRNVGGMDFLKIWLEKRKQAYDFKAQLWKLPEPKGLLLLGVPGCGKSLTAKCIASLWNMPLLRLDIGKVFHGIVGSSEDNIRRAIATAEVVAPCVLWIDEIEKGLSGTQSSSVTDGGTTSRIFSTILTWMQEKTKPVFVVATANDISLLPPELLRKGRFDEIFFVDLPNEEDRKNIFDIHLKKRNQKLENFELDKLAKESIGFNGAEIEECINEAMFTAYTKNPNEPKLQITHLLDAIKDTAPLSQTMKEQIDFLRKWAKSRAKQAGRENLEKFANDNGDLPLTKSEKALNRSF
jgi:SpoVK/Ycf46/Vps4 family AAA+-type ATPase